jgi:hypothetical protein
MPKKGDRTREVTAHRVDLSPKPSRWAYVAGCGCESCLSLERAYSRAYKRKTRAKHRRATSGLSPAAPRRLEGENVYA